MKSQTGIVALLMLTACTSSSPDFSGAGRETPQTVVARVARTAQTCWFKNKDATFKPYRLANEVNSFSGKPRFLIVPKNNPAGLPKLVVQAERIGGRNVLSTFGPLLQTNDGLRIEKSVRRWARGNSTCA